MASAAALCAGSGEAHLLYENRGAVCWAEGEAAVVEVGPGGCSLVVAGERRRLDAAAAPLAAVGRALAEAGRRGARAAQRLQARRADVAAGGRWHRRAVGP
ncbi:hypothetical protein [Streptomyces marincola]|uniref:hypothetical protein n=1 Tax=Streptomyces marincola TaxID=2878388 RepID=UPI00131BA1FF|nr:hypothetical protein [Streptomyces marincola]